MMPIFNNVHRPSNLLFALPVAITVAMMVAPFGHVEAIVAGEMVDWNRYGFLVKILARDVPGGDVKSCTGSLISASLVLTSGQCAMNGTSKEKHHEFVVFLHKQNEPEFRTTAKLLELKADQSWAIFRILPQNITELCPPSPAPKWVARLNFRPSLIHDPRLLVLGAIEMSLPNWSVIGFASADEPEDFLTQENTLRIYINKIEEQKPPTSEQSERHFWHSTISEKYAACYDDTGAPLFFNPHSAHSNDDTRALQLGLFQSLIMPANMNNEELENKSNKTCERAEQMRFSLFHDDKELARAIEKYALPEFVAVYQMCGFTDEPEMEATMGGNQ